MTASENREKGEIEEDRKNQPDVTKLPANVTLQEQLERMQLTEAREEEESEDDIEAENMEAEADQGTSWLFKIRLFYLSLAVSLVLQLWKKRFITSFECGEEMIAYPRRSKHTK